jgi:hypothetical protein
MGGNRIVLFLTFASALLAPNCATITIKSTQRIPVTSTPVGATVIVNGVQQGVTPLEIRLARKEMGAVIRIEFPGYNPVEIRPIRKMSGGTIFGNFLLGVIPGCYLSMAWALTHETSHHYETGIVMTWTLSAAAIGGLFTLIDSISSGYILKPEELIVTLKKAQGPPRVDTIVIDADRFGDIKWIRVRRD